jgi:hypothetical protein
LAGSDRGHELLSQSKNNANKEKSSLNFPLSGRISKMAGKSFLLKNPDDPVIPVEFRVFKSRNFEFGRRRSEHRIMGMLN